MTVMMATLRISNVAEPETQLTATKSKDALVCAPTCKQSPLPAEGNLSEEDELTVGVGKQNVCITPVTIISSSDRRTPITECGSSSEDFCGSVESSSSSQRSIIRPYSLSSIHIQTNRKAWKVLPCPKESTTDYHQSSCTTLVVLDSTSQQQERRRVTFDKIRIRSYSQTVGDNPSVSVGTPVQLDWDYDEEQVISLEDYESCITRRRTARQMLLNYFNRRTILQHRCGCTEAEIDQGEKSVNVIKRQRSMTRALLHFSTLEDMLESACRKVKRRLARR
jgi:hypothetical protein